MSLSFINTPNSAAALNNCTRRITAVSSTANFGNVVRRTGGTGKMMGVRLFPSPRNHSPSTSSSNTTTNPPTLRSFSTSSTTNSGRPKTSSKMSSNQPSSSRKPYKKPSSSSTPFNPSTSSSGPIMAPTTILRRTPISPTRPPRTTKPQSPPKARSSRRTATLTPRDYTAVPTKALALDCEMIEQIPCAASSTNSGLARLSIVNADGAVLLDTIVIPPGRIQHCRSKYTGLTWSHFEPGPGKELISYEEAQRIVLDYVENGHIIVGHALDNDLVALGLRGSIPVLQTRDTSRLGNVLEKYNWDSQILGLKKMTLNELGREIQNGFHDSVVDARATMEIYRMYEKELDGEVIDRPKYTAHVRRLQMQAKAEKEKLKAERLAAEEEGKRALFGDTAVDGKIDQVVQGISSLGIRDSLLTQPSVLDPLHQTSISTLGRRAYTTTAAAPSPAPPIHRTTLREDHTPDFPPDATPAEKEIITSYLRDPRSFLPIYEAHLTAAASALRLLLLTYPTFIGHATPSIPAGSVLLNDYLAKEQVFRDHLEVRQHFLPDRFHHLETPPQGVYDGGLAFLRCDYERLWRRWTRAYRAIEGQPISVMREDVIRALRDVMRRVTGWGGSYVWWLEGEMVWDTILKEEGRGKGSDDEEGGVKLDEEAGGVKLV